MPNARSSPVSTLDRRLAWLGMLLVATLNWFGIALLSVVRVRGSVGDVARRRYALVLPLLLVALLPALRGDLRILWASIVLLIAMYVGERAMPAHASGALAAILFLTFGVLVEHELAHRTFVPPERDHAWTVSGLPALIGLPQRLEGGDESRTYAREWPVPPQSGAFVAELSARVPRDVAPVAVRLGTGRFAAGTVTWGEEPVQLDETWKRLTVPIVASVLRAAPRAAVFVEAPPGATVEVADVRLRNGAGDVVSPGRGQQRPGLWMGAPNLIAHTLAAFALFFVAATTRRSVAAAVAGVALVGIVATGSRTAILGLLIGGALAFAPTVRRRMVFIALVATGLIAAATYAFVPDVLGRFGRWGLEQATVTARLDFMLEAWRTMRGHPWFGGAVPNAAHNFWLDVAARAGVPGLLAAATLTIGIVGFVIARAGLRVIGAVVGIFVMQVADNSLGYPGVAVPLGLAYGLAVSAPRARGR